MMNKTKLIHKVNYDFYKEYIDDELFNNIFEKRLIKIENQYKHMHKFMKINNLIEEYFVEIFCWTVIPKKLLFEIDTILNSHINNYTLIDLCSGNSFHTFLFNNFCKRNVITVDIQIEKNAWIETIENDALYYLKNYVKKFEDKILLLAWTDYDDLTFSLLKNFKGKIILSIGNYEDGDSKKYLEELKNNFELLHHFQLKMPWDLIENIKIFKNMNKLFI